jgi:phenylacetate-coenzyme A ligase PaaK-like adenylate-forming protein
MIAAAIAQLRLAVSLVTGRPVPSWAFNRLIAAGIDTVREFGRIESDGEETLNGPVLDDATRREVQLRRFRAQAQRAVNGTAFYGSRFADLGLDPGKLTWDEITRLPVTTKVALREHPDAFVHRDARPVLRSTTSGTTGRPTQVSFSERELKSIAGLSAIGYLMGGQIQPDDVVLMATSLRATLGNFSLTAACTKIGALVQPVGIIEPDQTLTLLTQELNLPGRPSRASGLGTYSSYLGELVQRGLDLGFSPANFGLRWISVGGEVVTEGLLRQARLLFGDHIRFDTGYAMTETYPFAGMPCTHGHLHFEPSRGLIEVNDPETGEASAPGQAGTLVVTPFGPYRETTILLRYDTLDVVRRLDEPPECELRHLPATSKLLGKLSLSVRHEHGWTYPAEVLGALEDVDDVPLPARCGFRAESGGVSVDVVVRETTHAIHARIAESLERAGVPLVSLHLVTDSGELDQPLPLRCDLKELGFRQTSPQRMEVKG